jgi:hypothetical protein
LEIQFAHVFETEPGYPTVKQAIDGARELNPDLDEGSWREMTTEVDTMVVSLMTAKGTGLDLALRTVFDSLSTPELKRLSGIFADPAFSKFFTAIISSEVEDVRDSGMDNERTAVPRAVRSVLEKHGLKVPQ